MKRLRGKVAGVKKRITFSFNPILQSHWIYKDFFAGKFADNDTLYHDENLLILHSTYLDNQFLGEREKKVLENLKVVDSVKYDIYALGKWGVLGNLIYTNYTIHEFEDDFDRHYNGLDWGYNDPAAFLKMGFRDQEIYIIDEFYGSGYDNPELMHRMNRDVLEYNKWVIQNLCGKIY